MNAGLSDSGGMAAPKLSFTTMATPELDHLGALALAVRFGFQGVDLRCSELHGEVRPDSSTAELRAVRRDFEAAGIAIPGLLCYNKPEPLDSDGRARSAAEILDLLAIAAETGAGRIRIFAGNPPEGTHADWMAGLAEILGDVLARDRTGIGMVVQNHAKSLDAGQCLRLAERIADARFGLVFSPDHCVAMGESFEDGLLERAAAGAAQHYVSDMAVADGKHRSVPPGEGIVPLPRVLAALADSGFEGFHSFKWERLWRKKLAPAEEVLPVFAAFMERHCRPRPR